MKTIESVEGNNTCISVFTRYGKCYTFNAGGDLITTKGGMGNGLELMLDIQQDEYLPVWGETDETSFEAGVKVQIHSQDEPSFIDQLGFGVAPGFQTFVSCQEQRLIYLPPPWGDCKVTPMDSDFFDSYSITACRIDCETRYLVDNCNCRMVHMPGDAPYCTPELYKECADPALDFLVERDNDFCVCETPCNMTRYSKELSFVKIPSKASAKYLAKKYNKSEQYIKENILVLDIFFEALNYETIEQKKAYEVAGLLGDIGGQMGLFIGASILTILELFDYLYEVIKYKLCRCSDKKHKHNNNSDQGTVLSLDDVKCHMCMSALGSAIAKIVGANAAQSSKFDNTVKMWVFEEMVNGRKLTEIINTDHENVKYLPGRKLPANVLAVPDLVEASRDADILVFVIPHQFIGKVCDTMKDKIKSDALGISLIKGVDEGPDGLKLISDVIQEKLGITMSVLMGANIANEVADEKFCETTIGCKNKNHGTLLKELMQTNNFRVTVVEEYDVVEICGALKNIVAVGAGFCDGLGFGDNTKAAVIRLGLMEMIAFARIFCTAGPVSSATFLESCGVADLITTCYGGRNRKVAEAFVRTGKSIEELEKEMLNGQKLQGPATAAEVYLILKHKNLIDKFPLFNAVYQICYQGHPVTEFISCLQNHPEHM
ncbi:hypothetical protein INR49_017139 [Caranx melampygus]|nr:hypothetical protein INR49_017139 [Caranx melampygus]